MQNSDASERAQRVVELNPWGVVAPVVKSLSDTLTVMRIGVPAIEAADLDEPGSDDQQPAAYRRLPSGRRIPMSFRLNDKRPAKDRKIACLNWILSRGFQELARAIRSALEEAWIYLAIVDFANTDEPTTLGRFQDHVRPAFAQAQRMSFPELMQAVNERLSQPLHFEQHFLSLQDVRNCLEHRGGVVTPRDTKGKDALVLTLPRLMMFYMRGREIELQVGETIEGEEGEDMVSIFARMTTELREFKIGGRVTFTADEFEEIAFGCWAFATDLSRKLPRPQAQEKQG